MTDAPEPDDADHGDLDPELVELHEILEWRAAVGEAPLPEAPTA